MMNQEVQFLKMILQPLMMKWRPKKNLNKVFKKTNNMILKVKI